MTQVQRYRFGIFLSILVTVLLLIATILFQVYEANTFPHPLWVETATQWMLAPYFVCALIGRYCNNKWIDLTAEDP